MSRSSTAFVSSCYFSIAKHGGNIVDLNIHWTGGSGCRCLCGAAKTDEAERGEVILDCHLKRCIGLDWLLFPLLSKCRLRVSGGGLELSLLIII